MVTSTELRRANERMVEQLRRAHEDLNHFVRALSHDMRANLFLVESSLAHLQRTLATSPSPGVDENLAHIAACLRQSRRLLDDLVELGRTGNVPVEPCRVELSAVVQEVLFEQRELIRQRGMQLDVRQPLPALWCNEDRLKQIVVNLVRNAIKHGCDPQQPRITIGAVESEESDNAPQRAGLGGFYVQDNGPGIAPQFHKEIFLPGRRLANAAPDGSGMGLAIVQKIVDHYGGAVHVDPACTAGSRFVVWLPVAPADQPGPETPRPAGQRLPTRPGGHKFHPHGRIPAPADRQGRKGPSRPPRTY
jgi:signal transduction histidine kinase